MIKVEMHCHTYFSEDGFITPKSMVSQCRKKNLDCVCITDHDIFRGAIEFSKKIDTLKIVYGQEVTTGQGDLIGLFLKEEIPSGMGLQNTIAAIKEQQGIVYLPHPLDEFRKSSVKKDQAELILKNVDIIEVFNSRTLNEKYNRIAKEFALQNNKITAVGSDAHHFLELGLSHVLMEDFSNANDFLNNLKEAKKITQRCPRLLRLYLKGLKLQTGKE